MPVAFLLFIVVISLGATRLCAQENVITNGATWRWRKGTNEASNPTTQWRAAAYNDSSWATGPAPFHYGDGLVTGTALNDMRSNYTCLFLRLPFVITNVTEIATVQLVANYDDGFVAWINGVEVVRAAVTNTTPAYTNVASASREADPAVILPVTNAPANYLTVGTNLLAVQGFNVSLTTSSDFRFETLLQIVKTNLTPPVITNVTPAANAIVGTLNQITVTFNEPVYGVDASDLLINDQPASAVSGAVGTNRYTFTFTQPLAGLVTVDWNEPPAITDPQGAPTGKARHERRSHPPFGRQGRQRGEKERPGKWLPWPPTGPCLLNPAVCGWPPRRSGRESPRTRNPAPRG